MQHLKGEVEKAAEETKAKFNDSLRKQRAKFNELLDNTGMQLWLARIEAMEEYAAGKHLEWDLAAKRLAYEEAKKSQNMKVTTTLADVADDASPHAVASVGAHYQSIDIDADKPHNDIV